MKKISVLIVEDEAIIADFIYEILTELNYEVIGVADRYENAISLISKTKPDITLVDINLKGNLNGIDLGHFLNNNAIKFIYLTSKSDSITIDKAKLTFPETYIIKPFTKSDIKSNLEIVSHKINSKTTNSPATELGDFFFIKEKETYIKIFYKNITHIEACDNYSIIYTQNSKHVISQTLKVIEQKLEPHNFFRTHRSFLANLNLIEKVSTKHVIISCKEIPVSEANRVQLINKLGTI